LSWTNWSVIDLTVSNDKFVVRPGSPITVLPLDGYHQRLFVTAIDGKIMANHNWTPDPIIFGPDGPNWIGWGAVAGGEADPGALVTAVASNAQEVDLFVTGRPGKQDRRIFASHQTEGFSFGNWSPIAGGAVNVPSPIGAVWRSPNDLHLFVTGKDSVIYTTSRSADGNFGGWRPVSNGSAIAGSPITAVSQNEVNLTLFAVDVQGNVRMTILMTAIEDWPGIPETYSAWLHVSGVVAKVGSLVTAALRDDGRLDLFVTDVNGSAVTASRNGNGGFSGWSSVGGGKFKAGYPVSAVWRGSDHLHAFATDTHGNILTTVKSGSANFPGWSGVAGGLADPGSLITAVARGADHLDLFVTGTDQQVYTTSGDF
jgi:hypothetical protein